MLCEGISSYLVILNALLNLPSMDPLAYHMPCIILSHCTSCIDWALSFLYVCLVLLDRRRYRGVRTGVRLLPRGGSCRFLFFWLDRRAPPLHLFYILLSLLYSILELRSCHVSYRMLPLQAIHPSTVLQLLFGFTESALRVVGLLSTVVISCYRYRYLLGLSVGVPRYMFMVISVGVFHATLYSC